MATYNFTTGPATLPDVGILQYEGCTFSPLYATEVSGSVVQDAAARTTKYMEYTLTADGYATLPDGATDIGPVMATLRALLTRHGGSLLYLGRGFNLVVNSPGAGAAAGAVAGGAAGLANQATLDVAWGPAPKLLEFQPLGAGRSAKVKWQVVVRVPELPAGGRVSGGKLLQFNYETVVSYGEDGFSSLTVAGTLEIPMTRTPTQATRTLATTADEMRNTIQTQILSSVDLSRFRVSKREFPLSRDKRTLEWRVELEEKPYMDLPIGCTVARGSFNVRPVKVGPGLCQWACTLRATYTVRADFPRKTAWYAFLSLLRLRMLWSTQGNLPADGGGNQNPGPPGVNPLILNPIAGLLVVARQAAGAGAIAQALQANRGVQQAAAQEDQRAWLIDFNFDEGLYLDSKTVTFSATWKLVTTFSHIMIASGLWRKVAEKDNANNNLWAISMRDVSGAQSWLANRADPSRDAIVDFGGP